LLAILFDEHDKMGVREVHIYISQLSTEQKGLERHRQQKNHFASFWKAGGWMLAENILEFKCFCLWKKFQILSSLTLSILSSQPRRNFNTTHQHIPSASFPSFHVALSTWFDVHSQWHIGENLSIFPNHYGKNPLLWMAGYGNNVK
jgi:hypothetical protein